jgi:asparagine synthase (glutamine-hydrolysing)
MCGIFGFAGFERPELLRRMADSIRHRGPDGEGFFVSGRFAMGMRRLSIIDLSGGGQPIYNEDHSIAVCFNGEIYNYVELVAELEEKGHRFRTHSDTEVIVHAYEQWGEECVDRFNGMFAFAVYDKNREELFIARDRAGQKPLYWWEGGGKLVFGSEVKALLECEDIERRPNLRAIDGYLALRYVPQPETLFDGIRVLPAGHWMRRKKDGELEIRRYWDVRMHEGPYRSEGEYQEEFEALFEDAVRLTLRSDVPVGAYLSGGIDSSLVVAAILRFKDKLKTFSIGFRSPIDETHEAKALAERLGTEHHEIHVLPEHFAELPKAIWHLERPIGDALILAYYELARETSKHLKVVLSGEGADENYAGYSFHKIIQWADRYRRVVPRAVNRGVVAPVLSAIPVAALDKLFVYPAYLGNVGKAKTVDFVREYYDRDLAESYVCLKALWDRPERERLYTPELRALSSEAWMNHSRMTGGPFLDRLLQLQFDDWLQDNLLLRQDKNTMASSLELRCPFLDHRVIEQAFRMPPRMKVRGLRDKWVERELGRKWLPPENVKRSKNPFYLPLEYFHGHPEIRDLIRMTLSPEAVRKRGWFDPGAVSWLVDRMETGEFLYLKQVMSLVILELWHRVFIDRERLW